MFQSSECIQGSVCAWIHPFRQDGHAHKLLITDDRSIKDNVFFQNISTSCWFFLLLKYICVLCFSINLSIFFCLFSYLGSICVFIVPILLRIGSAPVRKTTLLRAAYTVKGYWLCTNFSIFPPCMLNLDVCSTTWVQN